MARVSANSFDDQHAGSPYDLAYGPPRPAPSGRQRREFHDDRLLDDDLDYDGRSLMDKISHLKHLQGGSDCADEAVPLDLHRSPYGGASRGSYRGSSDGRSRRGGGRHYGDPSDLLPSYSGHGGRATGSRMRRREGFESGSRGKYDADKMTSGSSEYSGKTDLDPDFSDSDVYGHSDTYGGQDDGEDDHGRVRGLSNQIDHVKKLRKLPPFADLKAKRAAAALSNPEAAQGTHQAHSLAPKPQKENSQMNRIEDLMKQVKSMSLSDETDESSSKI